MRKNCLPLGFCFLCCAKIAVLQMPVKNQKCRLQHCAGGDTFYGVLLRKSALRLFQFVLFVGENYRGFECLRFFGRHHDV